MNINKVIFSRTAPAKKIETIKSLSDAEVLSITPDTTKRILKEVGRKMGKTRDREMRIAYERRNGNAWNSTIESVELIKNRLYVCLYVQFSNTDTTQSEEYEDFFARGNYRGAIHRTDRFGNPRTYYYIYDTEAKANVVKAAWVHIQYVCKMDSFKLTIVPDDKQKNQIVAEGLLLANLVPAIDDAVKHGSISENSVCSITGIRPQRIAV